MKAIFPLHLLTGCFAVILIFSACANQNDPTHRIASSTNRSSGIPTRDDRNSTEVSPANPGVGGANGDEYRVPTGSNLPQTYNRKGYYNDAQDPSFTYDQNDQRLQQSNSVGDSLRNVPGVSVPGALRGN